MGNQDLVNIQRKQVVHVSDITDDMHVPQARWIVGKGSRE